MERKQASDNIISQQVNGDAGSVGKDIETARPALRKEDIAAAFANYFEGHDGYSSDEARRLRWKLDIRLIPILWFNILLPAMDKVSHAKAAVYGLQEDLNLVGDQYSWIGSIFYVSSRMTAGRGIANGCVIVRISSLVLPFSNTTAEVTSSEDDRHSYAALEFRINWHGICQQLLTTARLQISPRSPRSACCPWEYAHNGYVVHTIRTDTPLRFDVYRSLDSLYRPHRLGHWFYQIGQILYLAKLLLDMWCYDLSLRSCCALASP